MLDGMQSALQAGFYTHRLLEHVGTWRAQDELASLRVRLVDALGEARGDALVAALKREIQRAADDVRSFVQSTLARRDADAKQGEDLLGAPLAALDDAEVEEVRRAVRPSSSGCAAASACGVVAHGRDASTPTPRSVARCGPAASRSCSRVARGVGTSRGSCSCAT